MLVLAALLGGLVTVPVLPQAALADSGCPTPVAITQGAGTQGSPYVISVPGQLQNLRNTSALWDKYFLVTADIDMGGCTWTSTIGSGFTAFLGQFDGGGHVISGLDITITDSGLWSYAGLFGQLGSTGVVTRVGFTGTSSGTGTGVSTNVYAGGLVGYVASGGIVSYSYATGSVTGSSTWSASAGGLVGRSDGTVTDSYSTGSASANQGSDRQNAGGFVGYAESNAFTTRTYSTGIPQVGAGSYVGGFAGIRQNGTWTGNLWDTTSSTKSAAYGFASNFTAGVAGKTTTQMQSFATFDDSGWPIVKGWAPFEIASNKIWGICEGSTRPFLLWQYTAQTRPCASAPAAPTITSVAPGSTTATVSFTADDSGGSAITRIEFALDDTTTIDDSTTNVSSPATLTGLAPSTTYAVYMRAVNDQGPGPWSGSASFTTVRKPGIPVITGVTPDVTTAEVSFTADDSGGAPVLRVELALDDTTTVDDSTTTLGSPVTLIGLTGGTTYAVYARAVNSAGAGDWSAATSFTTLAPPAPPAPPAPMPPSAPLGVRATPGDGSVTATWSEPATPGDYPVTNYQATATPGGRSCMTASTTCAIDGLVNGTSYTITVRALSGAGWSAASSPSASVTPAGPATKSLVITGSRGTGSERSIIRVRGTSTGVEASRATIWLSVNGNKATPASATVVIRADGTFTWSRRLHRSAVIYAEAAGVRSNAIRLPSAR